MPHAEAAMDSDDDKRRGAVALLAAIWSGGRGSRLRRMRAEERVAWMWLFAPRTAALMELPHNTADIKQYVRSEGMSMTS